MSMVRSSLFLLGFALFPPAACLGQATFPTPYERNGFRQTSTYHEGIEFYQRLADHFPQARLQTIGSTDAGHPLHLFVISSDGDFDVAGNRR
ncbi:MAG: hypothetical protein MI861_04200, partial [Pirellulales bacterium]|nr:hypothetical protein [Pirellulales bacterium]